MQLTVEIIGLAIFIVIEIIAFAVWVATLAQKVRNIENTVSNRDKHGERLAALESKVGLWNKENLKTESPVSLTDKGHLLLKESGAEEHITNNKKDLLKHFSEMDDPFDIQEKALKIATEELRKDKKIKAYLFQKGAKGIEEVAEVAGIALRDIVFKEKGMKV